MKKKSFWVVLCFVFLILAISPTLGNAQHEIAPTFSLNKLIYTERGIDLYAIPVNLYTTPYWFKAKLDATAKIEERYNVVKVEFVTDGKERKPRAILLDGDRYEISSITFSATEDTREKGKSTRKYTIEIESLGKISGSISIE